MTPTLVVFLPDPAPTAGAVVSDAHTTDQSVKGRVIYIWSVVIKTRAGIRVARVLEESQGEGGAVQGYSQR